MHCDSRFGQERNARNAELLPRYSTDEAVSEMLFYTKLPGLRSTYLTLEIDSGGADQVAVVIRLLHRRRRFVAQHGLPE